MHKLVSLLGVALIASFATPAAAQTVDSAFAVSKSGQSLFRVNVDAGATLRGTYDGDASGTGIPIEGAGTRFMWYPRKAAIRAGGISGTQWDAALIGEYSVAMGQDVRASAANATAFGLRTTAAQVTSFAAGEDNTASGASSVALGYHAHTNARSGSFVFGDRSTVDSIRAGVNHSANWRVSGGFRIFTASNLTTGVTIQSGASVSNWGQSNAVISTSTGALLTTAGVWQNNSDVNRKHSFEAVDGEYILEKLRRLPILTWTYDAEPETVRHLGPMAQDFKKAFDLGTDEKSIGTVDADGVALAGVKALESRTAMQKRRIELLERENSELRARLLKVEKALELLGTKN